jgi:hypothetical protein
LPHHIKKTSVTNQRNQSELATILKKMNLQPDAIKKSSNIHACTLMRETIGEERGDM